MSRFSDFSEKEKEILNRALCLAGRKSNWSLERIQALDKMRKELQVDLSDTTGDKE